MVSKKKTFPMEESWEAVTDNFITFWNRTQSDIHTLFRLQMFFSDDT